MIASTHGMSATCDEVAHLPAGYTYLAWGDFRLNPEHPPLVKALAAVPLVLFDHVAARRESGPWQRALVQPKQQWRFGHDFLYSTPGNDADRLFAHARLPMVAVAVLLGVLLWSWTREIWGEVPAAAAVVAWALEPNLLAHGPLVTTDVALATFSLGATYMLWRVCRELTLGSTLGLVLFVALAVLSKYSAVFLAPAMVAVLAVQVLRRAAWRVRLWGSAVAVVGYARKAAVAVILLVVVAAAAWTAIWGVFGFRFPASRGTVDRFPLPAEVATVETQGGRPGGWQLRIVTPLLTVAASHRLLPEAFIYGFAAMLRDAQNRPSYLLGAIHQSGRWYYFLVAILVKTPVPILVLAALGTFLLLRRRGQNRGDGTDRVLVFLPPLVFLCFALLSRLNLGVRHVLPAFPFLLLLAGFAAAELLNTRRRWPRLFLALAAAWLLVGTLRVFPHFLAYFNEVAGGPRNGIHWLVDSNLDWGQDLARLKPWMQRNNVQRVNLCYFGNADPTYYGIDFVGLPGSWGVWDSRSPANPELPGYVVISVTNLAGVGLQTPELRAYYERLLERATLVDTIGYSMFVYDVPAR